MSDGQTQACEDHAAYRAKTITIGGCETELVPFPDGTHFGYRQFGQQWQICTRDLKHLALCGNRDVADLIMKALNAYAAKTGGG